MDLLKMATGLLISKMGSEINSDSGTVQSALKSLLDDGSGDIDIVSIISNMNGSGLVSMAASWLGDNKNDAIDPMQILSLFGVGKVDQFAAQLGTNRDTAASGLSSMLPDLIDQNSKGGALLDSISGGKGWFSLAKKMF